MTQTKTPKLYSTKEAAEILHVSERKVRYYCKNRELSCREYPTAGNGHTYKISDSDIEEFLNDTYRPRKG